jgi:hypothetical protein
MLDQLIQLQQNYIVEYTQVKSYPKEIEFNYDFIGYIQSGTSLNNVQLYKFDFPEDKNISLQGFCEQIFFARRRNFGKSWITKVDD